MTAVAATAAPAAFGAMGTEVLVAGASPGELAAIRTLFAERERIFSRFREDSELGAVNGSRSPVVGVSEEFARAVRRALEAARATGGLVDPTLGAAIVAAGYDRDFASLAASEAPAGPARRGRWAEVHLWGRVVGRPVGLELDLNGVVKGMAVDDAVALLRGEGWVSAGGDVAARGPVAVALPDGGSLRLLGGGIATSGTVRRHWQRGGERQHHLIDPRTGRPAESPWALVTVAAGGCAAADVAAKAAFLHGVRGPAWLDAHGLPGRFVALDGSVVVSEAWRAAIGPA